MSRMSNTCGWDVLEWSDGSDYLVVGRVLYLRDYEFLECNECQIHVGEMYSNGRTGFVLRQWGGGCTRKTTNFSNVTNGGQRWRRGNLKRENRPFFSLLSRRLWQKRDDFSLKKLNFVGNITKQSKSYSTNNYHCNASKQECLPALSNLGSVFQ